MYSYATLDPRRTPEAQTSNDKTLAEPVLGIEVTVAALADRCTLGNIDPQHLGGDAGTAAIEAALAWPLPSAGAILATVRADADSVGAMAVLQLRATGYELLPAALEHVQAVATADKEASGPWPGPRPIEKPEDLLRPTTALEAMCMDHRIPLADRVSAMAEWISNGEFAGEADYRNRAQDEAWQALENLKVRAWGGMAIITGDHRLAMAIGYRYAPVVIATNDAFSFGGGEPHRKHTVARWNTQTIPGMDWPGMLAELNKDDPAAGDAAQWGGSSSIAGSPQGIASGLSTADVTAIVKTKVMGL